MSTVRVLACNNLEEFGRPKLHPPKYTKLLLIWVWRQGKGTICDHIYLWLSLFDYIVLMKMFLGNYFLLWDGYLIINLNNDF